MVARLAAAGGGGWDREAPSLIVPVDWGAVVWLEPVTGALEFDIFGPGMGWDRMGWDGMGWDGSCRRGSGAWSLEFEDGGTFGRCRCLWRQLAAAGPLH